jgi:hypothetical protein
MSHPCVTYSPPPFLFSHTFLHYLAPFPSPFPPLGVIKKVGEAAEQAGTTSLPPSTYIYRTHRYSQGPHPSPPSPHLLSSYQLLMHFTVLHVTLPCNALSLALHSTARHSPLHFTVLHVTLPCTSLYCTSLSLALHCTARHSPLHFTVLHCTLPCTALSLALHSPLHCTLPCTALSLALHSPLQFTLPCNSLSLAIHSPLQFTLRLCVMFME